MNAAPQNVRVRFAPSPTGSLHPGNVRTALLNWVFARKMGGEMVLRIEDTDLERHVAGAEEEILKDLKWLGLDWDEGPDVGGKYGPYRQSERADIHREYAEKLYSEGKVFYCYCTEEELEAERKKALAKGQPPRYSGRCRHLSAAERERNEAEGLKPNLRFRVPDGEVAFDDLIRGRISWDLKNVGDFVILRSNGAPSYNFAVAIDDSLMNISHVIRGDGHVSNTPRQLLVYEALGFQLPLFAHTASILNSEKKILSKRHGALPLRRYREEGYLPEALVNYMSLLSWSSESGDEIMPRERLVSEFSFKRMTRSAAVFDEGKLKWMNGQYIRAMDTGELAALLTPYLAEAGFPTEDTESTKKIVAAVKNNLATLSEVAENAEVFYSERFVPESVEAEEMVRGKESHRILSVFFNKLNELDELNGDGFRKLMSEVGEETGVKGKNLWMPLRVALTGRMHGPELPVLAEFFGKDKVTARVAKALEGRE